MVLAGVVAVLLAAAALAAALSWRGRGGNALARSLGLDGGPPWTGVVDGRPLLLETGRAGAGEASVPAWTARIPVDGLGDDVSVRLRAAAPERPVTGDAPFDARYEVRGEAWAWLSATARAGLQAERATLEGGELVVRRSVTAPAPADVRRWVALAGALAVPDPLAALAAIAREDPSPRMQVLALVALHEAGRLPPELSLVAACRPGPVGAVAAVLGDRDDAAARVADTDREDLDAIAAIVARHGDGRALDALPPPDDQPVDVVDAVVLALCARASPGSEAVLLRWIVRADASLEAGLAWLATRGTAAAVPTLAALAARAPGPRLAEVRGRIQARVGGERGAVSVAATAGGEVSLPRAVAGRVSEP